MIIKEWDKNKKRSLNGVRIYNNDLPIFSFNFSVIKESTDLSTYQIYQRYLREVFVVRITTKSNIIT